MAGEVATTRNSGVSRNSDGSMNGRVLATNSRSGPDTEYIYLRNAKESGGESSSQPSPSQDESSGGGGTSIRLGGARRRGGGVLANPGTLTIAWLGAMAVIAWDEWHNNGILPRPARLWYTSMVYGGLGLLAGVGEFAPLANAIGVGFVLVLLYQYYNKQGQFSG